MCENIKKYSLQSTLTHINNISLTQFKNYQQAQFAFNAPIVCITGRNGSGKTNLLDAIYTLFYTKSYFSSQQSFIASWDTDGYRIDAQLERAQETHSLILKFKQQKRSIIHNGVELEKLTDHIGSFAAVMIAPDDIGLINEGGEWRRKWMDGILSQLDAAYLQSLLSYQHLQVQRNAWLKQQAQFANADTTVLAYYNQEMHTAAAYIFNKRSEFLSQFMPLLQSYYEQLSASKEHVQLYYKSDLQTQSLLQWLEKELYHDVRLQRTNKGIHKDDLVFSLQGQSLKQFGSQGQKKSFLFALKLAQYHFIKENMQQTPILLLDDVFEKLDNERMEALLGIISGPKFGQVLLTDTDPKRLERAFSEQAAVQYIAL